ncbi:MAG TPA: hypothetical protein VE172_25205 [Stackebrandtia sp.]|jgi:hypothetical protein|uniref:hypothetical protein n=1 Tax=Stackebrandtia sp. TaxID=2023065 RepID=UPI002D707EF0|nr:hypothetical protein [Stackebrandtia sp.]HZE42108.1 hypothetical protein [Stackebrandtia sp.]
MTEPSPQHSDYTAAQQQQAAAYAQQQQAAYAAQQQQAAYAQQNYGPTFFDKVKIDPMTFGLAAGGAAALLLSALIHGAGDSSLILMLRVLSPWSLAPIYGILVVTAVAITTGAKYRNAYRAIVLGLSALEIGTTMSIFLTDTKKDSSMPSGIDGSTSSGGVDASNAASVIGIILYIIAIALFVAATITKKDLGAAAAAPHAAQPTGMIPTAQPQATGPIQQQYPTEPPTNWQQQPPQQ